MLAVLKPYFCVITCSYWIIVFCCAYCSVD